MNRMGHKRAKNNRVKNPPRGKSAQNARQLAVQGIELCSNSLVPLPVILNTIFQENDLYFPKDTEGNKNELRNRRDKAFCTQLVYGYFRHAGLLSLALKDLVKRPQDLPENCLITLYLGAYELLFLQNNESKKQATHATLFVYVEMVKAWHGQKLAGLVNGVLRNVQRQKEVLLVHIENAQRSCSVTISSNQIPSKKSIRHMYDLADLPDIFIDETNVNFLQAVVADSFFAPIATYRINEKFKDILQEKIKGHAKDHADYLEASAAEALAPKVDNFEWYLKKPLPVVSPANYAYFDDMCLYVPNVADAPNTLDVPNIADIPNAPNPEMQETHDGQETQEAQENQEKGNAHQYLKQWEQEGIITRQGVGSQLLAKKIASFIKANKSEANAPNGNSPNGNMPKKNAPSGNIFADNTFKLWDACCGRGGKSSALMEMGIPVALCSDPNAERLGYAEENLKRLRLWHSENTSQKNGKENSNENNKENAKGNASKEKNSANNAENPVFRTESAQDIVASLQNIGNAEKDGNNGNDGQNTQNKNGEQFSFILLDSPCSTSGTIARNPEVKNRITAQSLASTIELQAELLHTTWQCLKDKGYLVYVTCSLFSKENGQQIKAFLDSHNALVIEEDYIVPHRIDATFKGHDTLFYAILQKQG